MIKLLVSNPREEVSKNIYAAEVEFLNILEEGLYIREKDGNTKIINIDQLCGIVINDYSIEKKAIIIFEQDENYYKILKIVKENQHEVENTGR